MQALVEVTAHQFRLPTMIRNSNTQCKVIATRALLGQVGAQTETYEETRLNCASGRPGGGHVSESDSDS